MRDLIQVICENLDRTIEVEMGTSLLDIQRQYLPKGPHPYLAAYVNNRIKELNYKVYTPITVRYIDATHFEGIRVYERTASFILQRAVRELYPEHKFYIRHSMLRGFYCEIEGRDGISAREAEAIRTRMEELVDAAIPIIRSRVRSIDAAMEFTRLGFDDKTELLNTRPRGIHGLNPALTPGVPESRKFKIYVSCFTSVALDNVSRIATSDNRLLRRLTRDYRTRGNDALSTLARWESVRRGEEKHIFPYQENADVMFNSSLFYEISVLRRFAEPILREVPDTVPEYGEAKRMLKFLDNFIPISPEEIPPTSLLREFIGGSSFKY